ncbi:PAS domain-containing protein [Albirhodobacter sp. R86504]|uniref:PAS domain-containing sensor histidine kinase n=1 Tax=Albirhodobacter sp. R86504 TaxID=3093848 RepID=UPI003670429D
MIATESHSATVESAPPLVGQAPFQQMFDAMPALVAVFQGRDHLCSYSNPAHDLIAGPATGRKLLDVFPLFEGQGVVKTFDAVFTTGAHVEIPEVLIVHNGQRLLYRFSLQPWRDHSGVIAGVMSFAIDVTLQVQARSQAESTARQLAFALEISDGIGIFDWDTRIDTIAVDETFMQAFGIDPSQPRDRLPLGTFLEAIHPEDRPRVAQAVQHAVETGGEYWEEFRIASPNTAQRHVLARGRCLPDADGQPDHFLGVVIDITKQHRDRESLRESEERLQSVVAALDQGYCVAEIICNEAGEPVDYEFIDVNPKFEQMTGLQSATGRRMLDLVPNLEDKWAKIYGRVALEGETVRFEDGSEAMGRWFDVFATPVLPRGRFAVIFRDVTAEKRTQDALRKSEAEFRTITEAMPQIVWATLPDGYHDFYNARWYEFTGVPEGSTDGEGWSDIFHPDDQDRAWERWRHSLETGELYEIEYRLRHHSGQYRWVLGRAQPVRNPRGEIVRWLGTCTDIQELKLVAEQRQLMLGEMNHRVKNILSMVNATVMQTLRQAETMADARELLQSRISMMARAHDRLVSATWTDTRIRIVVDSALAPHRTGEGRFVIEGPDLPISAKQALALTMALHELATNAIKYGSLSQAEGLICIRWNVVDEVFTLTWRETGGPAVRKPSRNGFGSMMIEQALPAYFSGTAELAYPVGGLTFDLCAPLSGLTEIPPA